MKRRQMLSWVLSLVMALTVFSVPVSGFAGEDPDLQDVNAAVTADEVVAGEAMDEVTDSVSEDEVQAFEAAGIRYCFVIGGELVNSTYIDYNDVLTYDVQIRGDDPSTTKFDSIVPTKTVWHNNQPNRVDVSRVKGDDSVIDATFTMTKDHTVTIIPNETGVADLSVDVYDKTSSSPVQTLNLSIEITADELDAAKYWPYIVSCKVKYADYDKQTVYGTLPDLDDYNKKQYGNTPQLTANDLNKLSIDVTVGGETCTATINKEKYTYTAGFPKVNLGSKVEVTYTMGNYSDTDDKTVVTKWIKPTVKAKNYTYNGEWHDAEATVKYNGKTLKLWDSFGYGLNSGSRQDVGRCKYIIKSADEEGQTWGLYRFKTVTGYSKINPKGTSLKTVKKGKKALTVTWKKQSKKMSEKRITGYQIQLATNKKFTKNKKLVTVKGYKKTSRKVKKLKENTKYYVRVRTYMKVGKYKYYSKWSKVKSMKTAKGKVVEMTGYADCLKSGDIVYCNVGDYRGGGIYRVNIKTGAKKQLTKTKPGDLSHCIFGMKLKDGYLYYLNGTWGDYTIERIKTSGKSHKVLAEIDIEDDEVPIPDYAVKGKKIFYKWKDEKGKYHKKVMKLNGKNKKNTAYSADTKHKKTNKKGYSIIEKGIVKTSGSYEQNYSKIYLKTPTKKIYLTTVEDD